MRAVLLFLALACGGLAVLALASGGFRGAGREAVRPRVPSVASADAPKGTRFRISELAGQGLPEAELEESGAFSTVGKEPATWVDPLTSERIELPEYVRWWFRAEDTDVVPDPEEGQAIVFRGVRVIATKDPASLTREEARAFRAGEIGWRDLGRLEVESAEARADFLTPRLGRGDKRAPGPRTVVRFRQDVTLRDLAQEVVLRADDVTADLEAGTASGPGTITATSPDWTLKGRGFRLDREASRLEILEDAQLEVARLPADAVQGTPFEGGGAFRPARVRAKGGAVVSPRSPAKGSPYEVRLSDRVHVEQDGGRSLDADVVTLTLERRDGTAPEAHGPAGAPAGRFRVSRLLADGHVELATPREEACGADCLLRVATERFVVDLPATGGSRTTFEGRSTLAYRGVLALPGSRDASGRITASCVERMTYGPAPEEDAGAETVLALVGDAVVLVEPVEERGTTQRLAADQIRLGLRRPRGADGGLPTAAPRAPAAPTNLVATRFVADGRVRLEGTLLAGAADRLVGERLDRPDYLVVATGDGVRFVVHEEAPRERGTAGAAAPAAGSPAKGHDARAWRLVALHATREVRGRFSDVAGDRPLELEGETLVYAPAPGGMLRGDGRREAQVRLRSNDGPGDSIRAPAIGFRVGTTDDRLWTEGGRTAATVRVGGAAPAARADAAAAPQDLHLRGRTRVEIEGASAPGRDATVRVLGRAEVEVRPTTSAPGSPATHRLTADVIEVGLAQGGADAGAAPSLFGRATSRTPRAGGASPAASPKPALVLPGGKGAIGGAAETWALASGPLALSFDAERGLRSMTAEGGVVAKSATARFQGASLRWDAAAGRGSLDGGGELRALVIAGVEGLAQRIASSGVDFGFVDGRVSDAVFRAPVVATLHDAEAQSGEVARFVLRSDADLRLDGDRAIAEGAIEVARSVRAKGAAEFGEPLVLTTRRVVVEKQGLLSGGQGPVRSMLAEGKGTRIETGRPGTPDWLRAVGDRLEYDAAASRMTLTGTPDVWIERADLEATLRRFVWDPNAQLPDIEGARVRLRPSR